MKTHQEWFDKQTAVSGDEYRIITKHGWLGCLKEVSEELRNILEFDENMNCPPVDDLDTLIRIGNFCQKIFEETHD